MNRRTGYTHGPYDTRLQYYSITVRAVAIYIIHTSAGRRFVRPVGTVVFAVAVLVQLNAPAGRLAHEFGYAAGQRRLDDGAADQ